MKKFKDFLHPKEFIAFSCAGGRPGQYDKFNYTESYLHGQGGGPPEKIHENLNPRKDPEYIKTGSHIFFDPEKDNTGLGEEHNSPEHIGIPDYHDNGHVLPEYNNEQAKHAAMLSSDTKDFLSSYMDIIPKYTSNSYNLNDTLISHHRSGSQPPKLIKSHLDDDSEDKIDTEMFDHIINSHKLPKNMTVYSGLHFHPNEHRGKIAHVPCYMSTSLSPHVAKDFGKGWLMPHYNNGQMNNTYVKNILRLHLPEGHPYLFTDNASVFPGQGELILPRGMRYQLGQRPTHIIEGKFGVHFGHGEGDKMQYHIYTGRILK
jgi:hypothetical protein